MKAFKYTLLTICFFAVLISCSEDKVDGDRIGTITGIAVENGTNTPLENVRITTNPASSTVFTDEEGNFVLESVTVESYSVQAELNGYVTGFESATVLENESVSVAFELLLSNANNQPPTTPNLVFPEDLATEIDLEVQFTWESSDPDTNDDLEYTLELRNATTNTVEIFETAQDTFYLASGLELGTSYFWQVKVTDGINQEVSSSISQFTTITAPNNPFLFVKKINGNNVIFSGNESATDGEVDDNLLQLTDESTNSFRPRVNSAVNKVAFLRTVGSNTNIFTMNLDGSNETQITNNIPVSGFRLEEVDFTWAENGGKILYPNFTRLYSVNPDGGGNQQVFQTTDNSLITEIAVSDFDDDLVLLKTNNLNGYNARIFTVRLSTGIEETVVVENQTGAYGGIDISANANQILYTDDLSDSQNNVYRQFESRIFIYDVPTGIATQIDTDIIFGENDLDPKFSPDEGSIIFTRKLNNISSVPGVYSFQFGASTGLKELFTSASMADWD